MTGYSTLKGFINYLRTEHVTIPEGLSNMLGNAEESVQPISLNWNRVIRTYFGSRLAVVPAKWVYVTEVVSIGIAAAFFDVDSLTRDMTPKWRCGVPLAFLVVGGALPMLIRLFGKAVIPALRYDKSVFGEDWRRGVGREHYAVQMALEGCNVDPAIGQKIYDENLALYRERKTPPIE